VFETQMLWATIAHIANDGLALPVAASLLAGLTAFGCESTFRRGVPCATALGAGLLTKSYFLALVPIFLALVLMWRHAVSIQRALMLLCIPSGITGWWYARNWILYRDDSRTDDFRLDAGCFRSLIRHLGLSERHKLGLPTRSFGGRQPVVLGSAACPRFSFDFRRARALPAAPGGFGTLRCGTIASAALRSPRQGFFTQNLPPSWSAWRR
jgi:hypothetical protein